MKDMHMQNRTADTQKTPVFKTVWASLGDSFQLVMPAFSAFWPFLCGFMALQALLVFYHVPYTALKTAVDAIMFLSCGALVSLMRLGPLAIKQAITAFVSRLGAAVLAVGFIASLIILYDAARLLPNLTSAYHFLAVALVITIALLLFFVGLQAAAAALLVWPALNDKARLFNMIALWDMAYGQAIRTLWIHILSGMMALIIAYFCLLLFGLGIVCIGFLAIEGFSWEIASKMGDIKALEALVIVPPWFIQMVKLCNGATSPLIAAFCALVLSSTSERVYKHMTS